MAKAQAVKKIKQEYKEQEDGFNSHLNEIKLILAKRAMHALELPKGVEIKPGQLLSEKPVKARELTPDELRQIAKKYAEAIDTIAI